MIKDCPELANFFHKLVTTVSKFSFQLQSDNTLLVDPEFNIHPFEGDYSASHNSIAFRSGISSECNPCSHTHDWNSKAYHGFWHTLYYWEKVYAGSHPFINCIMQDMFGVFLNVTYHMWEGFFMTGVEIEKKEDVFVLNFCYLLSILRMNHYMQKIALTNVLGLPARIS